MKGGRTAPRDECLWTNYQIDIQASMKGGRTAPRDPLDEIQNILTNASFNEGGADCPPRHEPDYSRGHDRR